ncbi:MAG: adenylate/guanylate cyclase domain-containing protein [Pseudomonadales bacterium]
MSYNYTSDSGKLEPHIWEKHVKNPVKMKWLEALVVYLFPTILLEGKPWKAMWEDKERDAFVRVCRFFFFGAGCLYVGHYFFYDRALGLEPLQDWFTFRMTAAGASFAAFAFYLTPLAYTSISKIPAVATVWLYCVSQAMIVTWWDGTPWLFAFVFIIASMMVVRLSPLNTLLLSTAIMLSQTPFLFDADVPPLSLISTAFVTLMVLAILRTSHVADIRNFVLNQENIAAQKKIIELNIEFTDRLRAFIPRVIADRLEAHVKQNHLTVIQAAVEVLKPRQALVACLFSDIRGFTKGSKDLDRFVDKSVLPEMKACSNVVEAHSGIPRKIGDLIFAYFDDQDIQENVLRCLLAGVEISRINRDLNDTITQSEIRRFILISSGEAVVGNLGGLDSSIEITALGPPVNFLSRLDELTKHPRLAALLRAGDILICSNTAEVLARSELKIDLEMVDLSGLELHVRDFPEAARIFRVRNISESFEMLSAYFQRTANSNDLETLGQNDFRLAG